MRRGQPSLLSMSSSRMCLKRVTGKVCLLGIFSFMQLFAMPLKAWAATAHADAVSQIDFSIPAASLARVLGNFATRAGITLSYQPDLVAGRQSPGLQGRYSVPAGLAVLLQGSPIVAIGQADGSYVLRPASASAATADVLQQGSVLPDVNVGEAALSGFFVGELASPKLTASLLDTPRSITIVPAELLRENNSNSLADALRSVPGITFKGPDSLTNPAGDRPVIRGFDASNSLFVDGMRSVGAQSREIFSVEQVEVTQGPGSVYSGWGAGGGAVNLVSKVPRAENFFHATIGIGNADYRRSTIDVNRLVNDETAVRLNLMWQDSAKAGREQVTYRRWGIAPSVTFGLNTPSQLSLSYYHLTSDEMPDYSVPYAKGGGAPLNVPRSLFYGLLNRDFLTNTSDIVQAQYKLRLSESMSLRNLAQVTQARQAFIASNPQWASGADDILVLQAKSGIFDMATVANQTELSGISSTSVLLPLMHQWHAGAELMRARSTRNAYDIRDQAGNSLVSGGTCSVTYNCTSPWSWNAAAPWNGSVILDPDLYLASTTTDTASLYLLDTIRIDPALSLNTGIRYDHYRTEATGTALLSNEQGIVSYQIGVVYKPRTDVSLYASLSTSSNPVGADAGIGSDLITQSNQNLLPERVRSIETGVKWELVDHRLMLNAALFRARKTNARIAVGRDSINGGTQAINGIELGLRGDLTADWKMFAGMDYQNSRLENSMAFSAYEGKQFPLTPRKSFSLWTSYRLPQGFKAGFGVTYNGKMYANAANTNYVPAYTKFDAMIAREMGANLELQLNLYNLTDKRYYDVAYPVYASIAAGRAAVLTARMRF